MAYERDREFRRQMREQHNRPRRGSTTGRLQPVQRMKRADLILAHAEIDAEIDATIDAYLEGRA